MKVGSFLLGSTFALTPIAINLGLAAVNTPVALTLLLVKIFEYYCGKEDGLNNIARKLGLKEEELLSLDNFLQKTFKKSLQSSSKQFYKKYEVGEYSKYILFSKSIKDKIFEYISSVDYSKKINKETLSCVFNESSDYIKLENTITIIAGIDFNKYTKDLSSEVKNNILIDFFRFLRISLSHDLLSDSDKYKQFVDVQNQILNNRLDTIEKAVRDVKKCEITLSNKERKSLLKKISNRELFSNNIDEYLKEQSNKYQHIIDILDSHTDKLDQITTDVGIVKDVLIKKRNIVFFFDKCKSSVAQYYNKCKGALRVVRYISDSASFLWKKKIMKLVFGLFIVGVVGIIVGGHFGLDPGLVMIYTYNCESLGFDEYALNLRNKYSNRSYRVLSSYATMYYKSCKDFNMENQNDVSYVSNLYDTAIANGYDRARYSKGLFLYDIGQIDSSITCLSTPIDYKKYKPTTGIEWLCYNIDVLFNKKSIALKTKECLFLCYMSDYRYGEASLFVDELYAKSKYSKCLYQLGRYYHYYKKDYSMAYKCYSKSYNRGEFYGKVFMGYTLMLMNEYVKSEKILKEVMDERFTYYAALILSKIYLEHYYYEPKYRDQAAKMLRVLLDDGDSTLTIGEANYLYGKYLLKNADSLTYYYLNAFNRDFKNEDIYFTLIKNEQGKNDQAMIEYLYEGVMKYNSFKDSSLIKENVMSLLFNPIYNEKTSYGTKLRILNFIIDPLEFKEGASVLDDIFSNDSLANFYYNHTYIDLDYNNFIRVRGVDSIQFQIYSDLEKYYWYDTKKAVYYYEQAQPLANDSNYSFVNRGSYVYKLAKDNDTINLVSCCEVIYQYARKRDAEFVMKFLFEYLNKDELIIDRKILYRSDYDTVKYDSGRSYGKYFKMASEKFCKKR